MTPAPAVSPLLAAGAVLVDGSDTVSAAHVITRACADALDAVAVGVLVVRESPGSGARVLDVLAASSHAATDLELHQTQVAQGPCVDAVSLGTAVELAGSEQLGRRWPRMADAFGAAGVASVHAEPLRWRGETLGAVGVFLSSAGPVPPGAGSEIRLYADLLTVAVVHGDDRPSPQDVAGAIGAALDRTGAVERAKGVLMHVRGVDGATAFQLLAERAGATGTPLTTVADELLEDVARGYRTGWAAPQGA